MKKYREIIVKIVKGVILLVTYGFLIWKLSNIGHWQELKATFTDLNPLRILFFSVVLLLMPINWALETQKWQLLISKIGSLSFQTSFKAVLAGLNTGFVTPNRIGEFGGRILFLPPEQRGLGIALTLLNGFTQTLVLVLTGIAGSYFYTAWYRPNLGLSNYLLGVSVALLLFLLLYFSIPKIGKYISNLHRAKKFQQLSNSITSFNELELIRILLISLLRYIVFSFQFYLMLRFFGINLTAIQAMISIPTMYLLVTLTPSIAVSEPAIRGSYAVLTLSIFSSNEIGILLSGILIWLVNFVIPMLVGSYFLAVGGNLSLLPEYTDKTDRQ